MGKFIGDFIMTVIAGVAIVALLFGLVLPDAPGTMKLQAKADEWTERQKVEQIKRAAEYGVFDTMDRATMTDEVKEVMEERDAKLKEEKKAAREAAKAEVKKRKTEKEAVKKENDEEKEAKAAKELEEAMEGGGEVRVDDNTEEADTAERARYAKEPSKFIFVGDSRFAGMKIKNNNEDDEYIAESSVGIVWLKQTENIIKKAQSENSVIVLCLGVNDLWDINRYIEYLNGLELDVPLYVLTVGPVDHSKFTKFDNDAIEGFNTKLIDEAKNYMIIDQYSYLKEDGFGTTDGLHYTYDTYDKIYNFIKSSVREGNIVL